MQGNELQRFSFHERVVHWVVGVSFVLLLLTGLAFSYPSLLWITSLFGGGAASRVLHPWTGAVFSISLFWMFLLWVRDMGMGKADLQWFKAIRYYATHQHDKVPAAGKYNSGQKLFFWVQSLLGLVLLLSGLPLWFPEGFLGLDRFGAGTLNTMRLLHFLAALGGGLFLILHIYLGIVAYPGTARGMIHGKVTRDWAKLHHPLWHDEVTRP